MMTCRVAAQLKKCLSIKLPKIRVHHAGVLKVYNDTVAAPQLRLQCNAAAAARHAANCVMIYYQTIIVSFQLQLLNEEGLDMIH